ncbi:MAG: HAD family hydrolase [Saprospiraceae bacterium]|nr:HAD family hydrolase [Saprospiraceae bacterium]
MPTLPALFLDRDGVLNERTPGDYVKHPDAFIPTAGVFEALALLNRLFGRIVVVTNQAGVGRGLMTEAQLLAVHQKMLDLTAASGGRIDRAYYCPHRSAAGCGCRKPAPGMALQAQADFPDIDFQQAWMVGDSASDIEFGQRLGMKTALITGKEEETERLAGMAIDLRFDSLLAFARHWERHSG